MAQFWSCFWLMWLIYFCTATFASLDDNLRDAATCAEGEYGLLSEDKKLTCKPCNTLHQCPPGTGLSISCGEVVPISTDIHCNHCVPGKTFSANFDKKPCQPCRSLLCHKNEKIIGKCRPASDTSKCSGVCKTGYYTKEGRLDDCQPCSSCFNGSFTRVQKCKNDGMPEDKQCEVRSSVPPNDTTKKTIMKDDKDKKDGKEQGYQFYGHPAMFSSLLVLIIALAVCLAFVLLRRKCRKKVRSISVRRPEELSELHVDSGVDETGSYDETSDQLVETQVRNRKYSSSSGGRKVSYSSKSSNSRLECDAEMNARDDLVGVVSEPSGEAEDVFDEKPQVQVPSPRRRTSSSGTRPTFKRQNSNPLPEHKEEKFTHRRSISSIASLVTGPKGTKEETTPILLSSDYNSNEIFSNTVALPPETCSSAHHRLTGVKINELNEEKYQKVCKVLNHDMTLKDWRTLAGRMDYKNDQVKVFAKQNDPVDALLGHWGTEKGNDVAKLIKLLKGMNRSDVVEILESHQR